MQEMRESLSRLTSSLDEINKKPADPQLKNAITELSNAVRETGRHQEEIVALLRELIVEVKTSKKKGFFGR